LPAWITKFQNIFFILKKLSEVQVLNLRERREEIGKLEALRLLEMKNSRESSGIWPSLQATVQNLLGVKIEVFSENLGRAGYGDFQAELDVDQFVAEVNGSGIKEALRVVLDAEFGSPNILLVEEPEVHLHPGLERSLMQYLLESTRRRQVFITTHSTNFIDTAATK